MPAAGEMVSRSVQGIPKESKSKLLVFIEKHLRNHYLDIKRIYNNEYRTDFIELIKTGNDTNEAGNCKLIISGDDLIMQAHDGSDWIDTGWKLKLA